MGYVSNSPVDAQDATSLSRTLELYFLPSEVFRAFTAKYSLSEIFEYSKLRKVLSIEDVARLEVLRKTMYNHFCGTSNDWTDPGIQSLMNKNYECRSSIQTDEELSEVRNSVNVMVQSEALAKEVMDKLTVKEEMGCEAVEWGGVLDLTKKNTDNVPYRVFNDKTGLYIIVEEGFLTYLASKEKKLAFLSCILKAAYTVFPIRMVNSSTWYKQYLEALAA